VGDKDDELKSLWWQRREEIEGRLVEFCKIRGGPEKRIFEEMCFCLLTPQSSALAADRAIRHMVLTDALHKGSQEEISSIVAGSGILYARNKGRYIVEAREKLVGPDSPGPPLRELLVTDPFEARENVVKNVKGLGYKESSHFLRNVGYRGLAILDRHILRTMREAGLIPDVPKTLSRKTYLELEKEFLGYARRLGVPADGLDLLMWSAKTGRVFK
jgi:N-glycosylase/DNA lyase